MTEVLLTLKHAECSGDGLHARCKMTLKNAWYSRVKKECLATLAITSSRSFNEIKMDDHMARQFAYGGVAGWERPSNRAVETKAVHVSSLCRFSPGISEETNMNRWRWNLRDNVGSQTVPSISHWRQRKNTLRAQKKKKVNQDPTEWTHMVNMYALHWTLF